MASMRTLAVLLVCIWAAQGSEVQELAGMAPEASETAFDENAGENGPTSLFPGPTYGLPGYKESHDWVAAYDIFSPLIFDAEWYAIKYGLESSVSSKADWAAQLSDDDNSFPDKCRQGSAQFSPQKYYRANPDIKPDLEMNSNSEETCGSIIKQYLSAGMLDGALLYDANEENLAYTGTGDPDDGPKGDAAQVVSEIIALPIAKTITERKARGWAIGTDFKTLGADAMNSVEQYTLTFWYKPVGARQPECNVIHHGNTAAEKIPSISQATGGQNRLKFVVAQTNNDEYQCTPLQELEEEKWHFITLKVETSKLIVKYNGAEVCNMENSGGKTLTLDQRNLYVSSPFQPPADGYIQKLTYYPLHIMDDNLLDYTMEETRELLEDLK